MKQNPENPNRKSVIALFYLGLLALALLAIGIARVFANFWVIDFAWLNQVLGFFFCASGLTLLSWSVQIQYKLGEGTPSPRYATRKLVTQGPYAFSRNPMTLGAFLIYLGIGIWMASGVVVLLTGVIFSGLLTFIYHHETRELTARFGAEYLEYKQRTPFFLPKLG